MMCLNWDVNISMYHLQMGHLVWWLSMMTLWTSLLKTALSIWWYNHTHWPKRSRRECKIELGNWLPK